MSQVKGPRLVEITKRPLLIQQQVETAFKSMYSLLNSYVRP